jgi:hypothetical protein
MPDASQRRASLENPGRRVSVEVSDRTAFTAGARQGTQSTAAAQPGAGGAGAGGATANTSIKGGIGNLGGAAGLPAPAFLFNGPPSQTDTPTRVCVSNRMEPPSALVLPPSHPTSPTAADATTFSPSPSPSAFARVAANSYPLPSQYPTFQTAAQFDPGAPTGSVSSNGLHGAYGSQPLPGTAHSTYAGSINAITPLSMSGAASPSSHVASPRRRTPMETKKASEEKQVGWPNYQHT